MLGYNIQESVLPAPAGIRPHAFPLISIGCAALLIRLLYLAELVAFPDFGVNFAGLDADLYHGLAQRVAGGDLLLGNEVYHYSPLYAYFLGGLYALFGSGPWVARLANCILGTATVCLTYLFAARAFSSRRVAILAALGIALYGPFVVLDTSRLKVSLGLFLIVQWLWLMQRAGDDSRILRPLLAGIHCGLALNIFGQMYLAALGACFWLFFSTPKQLAGGQRDVSRHAGGLRKTSAFLLGLSMAVLPFALRNAVVAGDLVVIKAGGGIHLYVGNHEEASGRYKEIAGVRPNPAGHFHDARHFAETAAGRALRASEADSYWTWKALRFVWTNPADSLTLMGSKILLLVSPYEIPNNENYRYLVTRSRLLSALPGAGLLIPLACLGFFLAAAQYRQYSLLYTFTLAYAFGVMLTFVTWRYRVPLALTGWPFASFAIVRTLRWIRNREFVNALLSVTLGILLFLFCFWNWPDESTVHRDIRMAEQRMSFCMDEAFLLQQIQTDGTRTCREVLDAYESLVRLRMRQRDLEGASSYLKEAEGIFGRARALGEVARRLLSECDRYGTECGFAPETREDPLARETLINSRFPRHRDVSPFSTSVKRWK